MSLLASTSKYVYPVARPAVRAASAFASSGRVPYTLHAQCSSNNTILTLSIDSPFAASWGNSVSTPEDRPNAGRKVFSLSCGNAGYKKAQRGTYEAATQTILNCFNKMDPLLEERGLSPDSGNRKKGQLPPLDSLTISLNGFGQGREAIYSVLTMGESYKVRRHIRTLIDKTPIKIGGARTKKTRVL